MIKTGTAKSQRQVMMVGATIFILILIILAALLFSAMGSEITMGIGTMLWLVLASFVIGAVWTIIALAGFISDQFEKLRRR